MTAKAILTDITRCVGCDRCVEACKRENALGEDKPRRWKRSIDDLSSTRYTTVVQREGGRYVRRLCRHCLEPACVSACLVGAMQKTPEGAVVYDTEQCMGCRYCMLACPYGIPRYDWDLAVPYVRKCSMCHHRIVQGKKPACVEACTEKATIFGDRDELIREAHRRIEMQPSKYIGKVFGEREVGGSSVLYLSDIPLGFLSVGTRLEEGPLPSLTWAALNKVPAVAVGMGALMTGTWWVIGRRRRLEQEVAKSADGATDVSVDDEKMPSRPRVHGAGGGNKKRRP